MTIRPAPLDLEWLTHIGIIFVILILCVCLLRYFYRKESMAIQQRSKAEKRAQELLQEKLTFEEWQQLHELGYLEVRSGLIFGRTYRIPLRRGQVSVFQDGRFIGSLCIQPMTWVPDADVILMHKLMLEGNEESYLHTANFFKPIRVAA